MAATPVLIAALQPFDEITVLYEDMNRAVIRFMFRGFLAGDPAAAVVLNNTLTVIAAHGNDIRNALLKYLNIVGNPTVQRYNDYIEVTVMKRAETETVKECIKDRLDRDPPYPIAIQVGTKMTSTEEKEPWTTKEHVAEPQLQLTIQNGAPLPSHQPPGGAERIE